METIDNDILSLWREEGCHIIQKNFNVFRSLVAQAKDFAQRGKYDTAATYADVAALYATLQHSGIFVSLELEQVLLKIGREAIQSSFDRTKNTSLQKTPKNVLHVATSVKGIGGHSRMIWRWIQQDTQRSHSVVLTRQEPLKVPRMLTDVVTNSHGSVCVLNNTIGSLVSWAKRLREIAASADVVVLHTLCDDVIPSIAFANEEQSPPIVFVNHADQYFWLGASISNVVANLRKSGMTLSKERRGVEAERNLLLPIILNPTHRTLSRTEAKRQLGLDESSILILSIARSVKYRTINESSFADVHIPVLKQYDRAILIVIGPGNSEDWSSAIEQTQGRIRVFQEREDTAVFLQAADIYVDSFPMPSTTSLLEAGSYDLPLLSRFPYSDASDILSADAPGMDDNLIRVRNLEQYTEVLSRLIEDEKFRLSLGEATKKRIAQMHTGDGWQHLLEDIYTRAANTPRPKLNLTAAVMDTMFLSEPDVLLPRVFSQKDIGVGELIQSRLRLMPFTQRLHIWSELIKKHGFGQVSLLLPEWFYLRYYSRLREMRL
jgi:hypothetical protein